jgi:hypothetical protein
MKILSASATVFIFTMAAFSPSSFTASNHTISVADVTASEAKHGKPNKNPKIQAAILLDVSNSMDGLIEQAKAQLWNMVSIMGRAKCENGIPKIEIALYEYGRDSNDPLKGYIKQITGFSSDLDNISQELFKLSTNGGEEYCGHVIHTSLDELEWDSLSSNYKVIFIAGNEDFLQGSISYTQSCRDAKKKGVIVNTIYCGNRNTGIREHWNLGAECGNGSYTNIDPNAAFKEIETPYDSALFLLNNSLNRTYLTYGYEGEARFQIQAKVDQMNYGMSKSAAAKRVGVKGDANLYSNQGWDMVDAYKADTVAFFGKLDKKTLPDSLRNKSVEEIQKVVKAKTSERAAIQKEIVALTVKREGYISAERTKLATDNTQTLETEVEKIIKQQVKRFNMIIE